MSKLSEQVDAIHRAAVMRRNQRNNARKTCRQRVELLINGSSGSRDSGDTNTLIVSYTDSRYGLSASRECDLQVLLIDS